MEEQPELTPEQVMFKVKRFNVEDKKDLEFGKNILENYRTMFSIEDLDLP